MMGYFYHLPKHLNQKKEDGYLRKIYICNPMQPIQICDAILYNTQKIAEDWIAGFLPFRSHAKVL